jgi:hypothetical protein
MPETRVSPATQDVPAVDQKLTREEDDELRRLHWFSQIGVLSLAKRERMLELRLRDRRKDVRAPREFAEEKVDMTSGRRRKWYQFRSR